VSEQAHKGTTWAGSVPNVNTQLQYNPGRKFRSIFLAKVCHFRVSILHFLFGTQTTLHCRCTCTNKQINKHTHTHTHTHTKREYAQRFFLRYSFLHYKGRTPLGRNIKMHQQMWKFWQVWWLAHQQKKSIV